jgi:hypothetical protein
MDKISIIEVENALKVLYFEIESSEGVDAYELIRDYINQIKEDKVKEGKFIIE